MGTPGLYLDPAAPGVADWLVALFGELVTRYPALAGLHLDYIRYPDVLPFTPGSRFGVGLDFGYGEPSRARFAQETGKRAPFESSIENADAWDDWRRERVSALVREIARTARAQHPGIALSAAVWSHADRAYLAIQQDWRAWLEEGSLDFAVPMAYTRDDRLLRYQAEDFAGLPARGSHLAGARHVAVRERAAARARADPARAGRGPAPTSRSSPTTRSRASPRCTRRCARRPRMSIDLDAYDFALPPDRIAQEPTAARDGARLLRLARAGGARSHHAIRDLPALLAPGDLLVVNATRVLPARLRGQRSTGGAAEALVLGPGSAPNRFRALVRTRGRQRAGLEVSLSGQRPDARRRAGFARGRRRGGARVSRTGASPYAVGEMPLPPYIRRDAPRAEDAQRYQTVFAREPGSVAAPTAGLHLSEALLAALAARGDRARGSGAARGARHVRAARRVGAPRAAPARGALRAARRDRARDPRGARARWARGGGRHDHRARARELRRRARGRRAARGRDRALPRAGRPLSRGRRAAHQLPPAALLAAAARRGVRGARAPCSRPTPRRSSAAIASTPTAMRC